MSANLDKRADGTATVFSVREDMWHRSGRVLAVAPATVDEALEQSGTAWEVEAVPLYTGVGENDYLALEHHRATKRLDTGAILGVVGPGYHVLQNREAFEILQPLMDNGLATWETGGSLNGGADVWGSLLLKMPSGPAADFCATEGLKPYLTIHGNHTGERSVAAMHHRTRIVCANTLRAAGHEGDGIKVSHRRNVGANVTAAAQTLFDKVIRGSTGAIEQYRKLRASFLDLAMFRKLVLDTALPLPDVAIDASVTQRKANETRRAGREVQRDQLAYLWTNGAGHEGTQSAWEAYNGLVEALDHRPDLFPVRVDRLESSLSGRLSVVHDQVFAQLLTNAGR